LIEKPSALAVTLKTIRFRSSAGQAVTGAAFRVFAGQGRAGRGLADGRQDTDAICQDELDDPSFPAAINAALVVLDGVRPWSGRAATAPGRTTGQPTPPNRRGGRGSRGSGQADDAGYIGAMTALPLLAAAVIACTAPKVHDGDTLRCGADRIRLFGVDAPEVRRGKAPAEPFADEARELLVSLTRGRVGCRVVDHDRYGRHVARCWSDATPGHQRRPDPLGSDDRVPPL
jgi:endonuclease YncB( thermonuclease family)